MVTPNRRMMTWNELIRPRNVGLMVEITYFDPDDELKVPISHTKRVRLMGSALVNNERVVIVYWDHDNDIYLITRQGQNIYWNAYLTDDQMLWYENWKL